MRSMLAVVGACVASLAALSAAIADEADLPSAEAILRIHRANQQRLSPLHLQLMQVYESTPAACRRAQQEADEKQRLADALSVANPQDLQLAVNGRAVRGAEALAVLQQLTGPEAREAIEMLRQQATPFRVVHAMEFFIDGENYQFRRPVQDLKTDEAVQAWKFPDAPLSTEALRTTYRDIGIFSRSATARPAARWWHHSVVGYAYVMHKKHLVDVMSVNLPPGTDVARPRWDSWHPYDGFFSQPADKYRVVRQEEIDGRLLTVVDVAVPMHSAPGANVVAFRAWLDLARGAVPLRLYQQQATPDVPVNAFDRWQPSEVTTTHAVRELPGGGCYPAKTVMECWQQDADAPPLTLQELAEVREGKRRLPMSVHRRYTWDCSLVEVSQPKQADFFVLPFSEEQKLYDHDAGKVVGALEEKPLVEVGQPAPPWSIGRWLDGRTRTLEELKGQVVVLNFWGLTCGGCRDSVSQWKAIQDRFADRPVAFIGIHTAEADSTALAARITEFQRSHKWLAIGAIDAGRMTENSVTTNAYGIKQFPCTVIVDPAGKVAYVDPYLDGPACDEDDEASIAEFEQKFNAIMAERFQAVGETWPMSNGLDEKAQQAIGRKVEALYLTRQIESALNAKR